MVRRGPTPPRKGHGRALANAKAGLLSRVLEIVEAARGHAARSVNSAMVHAYWMIGREIVVLLGRDNSVMRPRAPKTAAAVAAGSIIRQWR